MSWTIDRPTENRPERSSSTRRALRIQGRPLRVACLAAALLFAAGGSACKPEMEKHPPPRHSVALATPVRGALHHRAPGTNRSRAVRTDLRVAAGSRLSTAATGRAILALDKGGWLLLDRNTRVDVAADGITLTAGRVFVDARGATVRVQAGGGGVRGTDATFAVAVDKAEAQVYCAAAEVTLTAGSETLRLVGGMTASLGPKGITPQPAVLWDDWTGGLAQAGPLAPRLPAGVGVLEARTASEWGQARSPLLVREHRVRATITGDLVVTQVEQQFFNPRSATVQGNYRIRLPAGAVLASFAAGPKGHVEEGRVVPRARRGRGGSATVLAWEAPDRYVASLPGLGPGSTTVIRIGYVEWLDRRNGRRRWVYPMAGEGAPKLGELSIAVNVQHAGTERILAGLGAKRDRAWIRVRRSDYRPRANFVLELLDEKAAPQGGPGVLYVAPSGRRDEPRYVRLGLPTPFGVPAPEGRGGVRLVVVADLSAGTGADDLALIRQTVEAIFRQLGPKDQVALLGARVDAVPLLGSGQAPLGPATPARKEALLAGLDKLPTGGGSDLGRALDQAARLLPHGRGAVLYVGDGRPTLGALVPARIRDRFAGRLTPPRLFAVGVGEHAAMPYLQAITTGLGAAAPVRSPQEAPRVALRLVARMSRPAYRKVSVDLGPTVDRIYPRRPVTVEAGTVLRVLGRLRGAPPKVAVVTGLLGGKRFRVRVPLRARTVRDAGDLRRRWGAARIRDLLEQGAGREAVADVGVRFGVVSPFTGLLVGHPELRWYPSHRPVDPTATFVPEALRGAPPAGAVRIALEPGWATRRARARSLAWLYQRALRARIGAAARASFDRKAAARRDLSGQVVLTLEVNPDGTVHKVTLEKNRSTLPDPDVRSDLVRLAESARLPPTPTGKRFAFVATFRFAPRGLGDVPQRCLRPDGTRKRSPESYRYLSVRRVLWRERLARNASVVGVHRVWRGALACGEIQNDTDARALLRLMLRTLRTTRRQVDLYQRLRSEAPWIRPFLRREILRGVRSLADVRAVRAGLALDGGLDRALLDKMLAKARTDQARLTVAQRFLALSPESLTLRVLVLSLLERTGHRAAAERIAWKLRADPAADAGVRQAVAGFFWRQGKPDEARRTLTEIVELAPFDPWARRRLARLLLALADEAARTGPPRAPGGRKLPGKGKLPDKGKLPGKRKPAGNGKLPGKRKPEDKPAAERLARQIYADAYRELQTLAWLQPGDPTVHILIAQALHGMGRVDQSLRFLQRVAENAEAGARASGAPAWARLLASLRLAALRRAVARQPRRLAEVRARARRMGVHGWARDLTLALTWAHPDARFSLLLRFPGADSAARSRAPLRGVGLQGARFDRAALWGPLARPAGKATRSDPLYLEVRLKDSTPGHLSTRHARLWVLEREASPKERLRTWDLLFSPKDKLLGTPRNRDRPRGGPREQPRDRARGAFRAKAFLLYPDGRVSPTAVQQATQHR